MKSIDIKSIKLTEEQQEILKETKKSLKEKGQAAILLRPGGGKSYVSAKLITELCASRKGYNILWISTPTSIANTKSLIGEDNLVSDKITYVTFNELALNSQAVDRLEISNDPDSVSLIVVDEAHQALAIHTYMGIEYTLKKFKSAKILAMTATKRRYSDKKKTFEWLTPKLVLGVDYKDRGLKYSIENNLVCDFTYKVCDIQRIREYCNILRELQNKYSAYKKYGSLLEKGERIVGEYTDNIYHKLSIQLQKDLVTDGSHGDRWFVFYKRIADLKEDKENIESLFRKSYNNSALTINLIEFHNEIKDDSKVVNLINSEPLPNTVDVILTCNKGSQSLHPDHTRGIIMNRATGSETILEQQLGRCMINRTDADDGSCAIIYDCVNNKDYIAESNNDDSNISINIMERFADADITSNQVSRISKKMDNCFDIEMMDEDIMDVLEQFEYIKETYSAIELAHDIDIILCTAKGNQYNNFVLKELSNHDVKPFNPYKELKEYDKKHNDNMCEKFEAMQTKFIQGFYGDGVIANSRTTKSTNDSTNNADNTDKDKDISDLLVDILGDVIYITSKTRTLSKTGDKEDTDISFMELKDIASNVAYCNFDYANRISKTHSLKERIRNVRRLNIEGELPAELKTYCIRNGIDIDGRYTNLINEVLSEYSISESSTDTITKFKSVNKIMYKLRENNVYDKYIYMDIVELREIVKNGISTETVDMEDIELLSKAISKMQVFENCYGRRNFGQKAVTALKITYSNELQLKRIVTTKQEYLECAGLIRAVNSGRINIQQDENLREAMKSGDGTKLSKSIKLTLLDMGKYINTICKPTNKQYDLPVIATQRRSEHGALRKYEMDVLTELGISVNNSRANANIKELIHLTYFGRAYKFFIDNPTETEYKFMMDYGNENMNSIMRQMLNTKKFRECEAKVESQTLFDVDDTEVINLVKSFIYDSEDIAKKIKKAVKDKHIDGRKLIKYTLPEKVVNNNLKLFNSAWTGDWASINETERNKIYVLLKSCNNGYDLVIENLLKYGLIPEGQIQMAQDFVAEAE